MARKKGGRGKAGGQRDRDEEGEVEAQVSQPLL